MSTLFEIPDWLLPEPSSSPPPVDDHRVEGLVNGFIAGKQDALFDAPDAYYRQQGLDAVDGAPAIVQRLQDLRLATLDRARDDGERAAGAIRELINQNGNNPAREAQLDGWQKGDARMQAGAAISIAAEYLRFLFDKFGHSWVNAAVAYKSGETELRPFLRGQASALDNEAAEGGKAKGYLSIVFDGNPKRYGSYR